MSSRETSRPSSNRRALSTRSRGIDENSISLRDAGVRTRVAGMPLLPWKSLPSRTSSLNRSRCARWIAGSANACCKSIAHCKARRALPKHH